MSERFSFSLPAAFLSAIFLFSCSAAAGQSTSIEFPTPAATNQISGTIKARDLGDSRLTSHYYVFEGAQGDIIIRVQTTNFDGDIDVFNAQGLRPVTKMSFISGTSLTESVREIYLRKSERMILRVEGRSANDEAAAYRIIFEGSFRPSAAAVKAPEAPEVKAESQGAVRVNSVGTIIETKKTESEAAAEKRADEAQTQVEPERAEIASEKSEAAAPAKTTETKRTVQLSRPPARRTAGRATGGTVRRPPPAASSAARRPPAPPIAAPDPLADVKLVVLLKAGDAVLHPINQVQRFSVERGVLTIILKTGRIIRIAVKDIARMTVE